jgi:hypothetical protein
MASYIYTTKLFLGILLVISVIVGIVLAHSNSNLPAPVKPKQGQTITPFRVNMYHAQI